MRKIPTHKDDVTDHKGRSCFMWAVLAENESIVRWMLDNKSLSIDRRAKDIYYCTALHLAAQIGSLNICKLLIKQGWSLTDRDINEATPSHLAAGAGHTELIRYFQTALADKNEVDAADRTPLFYACAAGQTSTVQIMICDLKFPITVVDRHGQTPLHYAAYSGIAACLRVLLQRPECNVNAIDENGKTALHIACQRGKIDIIKLLVEAGADPNLSSMKSETPFALAMAEGNTKIIDALTVSNENL
uniref:ANK_REP_REGION domain-containing protein n=1 Tax=Panagrolaimus davidi TaxID=227884 RepID=A0A914QPT2_9BILA